MKKILAFALVLVLMMSLSVTAFAAGSPKKEEGGGAGSMFFNYHLYDKDGKETGVLHSSKVRKISVGNAYRLGDEDQEKFLKEYEEIKNDPDSLVRYFFWLDVDKDALPSDFAYFGYYFTCPGKDVKLSVNGKDMEVERVSGNLYLAKLTEFGRVAISCA